MRRAPQSNRHAPDLPSVDYLLIGHLSEDRGPDGVALGGTVAYSGVTAQAMGRTVGIVTSCSDTLDLAPLGEIAVAAKPSPQSTSFENRYTTARRVQMVLGVALPLVSEDVPEAWSQPEIVHIAPLAGELGKDLIGDFPQAFVGFTPQGLMREWDEHGLVSPLPWQTVEELLPAADAVVLSEADLDMDSDAEQALASICKTLAITRGSSGASVYSDGEWRSVSAPETDETDPTGAGDIFAAAFFAWLQASKDPWAAAVIANRLAAASVSRYGLSGAPSPMEARAAMEETGS